MTFDTPSFRFYKTLGLLCHFLRLSPEIHQVFLDEVLHIDALADDINHTIKIISNDNYFKKVCTFATLTTKSLTYETLNRNRATLSAGA